MGWLFGTRERNQELLRRHLQILSHACPLLIDERGDFVIVGEVRLPDGYNWDAIPLLIEIPDDYPFSPPGIGDNRVYVPANLRFRGRELRDLHDRATPSIETPGHGPWAWWCYETIRWDPTRDTLITFVEMIRADMKDPALR